jgi:glucose dehydrogenase
MSVKRPVLYPLAILTIATCAAVVSSRLLTAVGAQNRLTTAQAADWPLHNLDLHNSRYAQLTAINASNAGQLTLKWSFDLPSKTVVGSSTPLVVDGVMYFNSGSVIFAVDAATGKSLWTKEMEPAFPPGGRGPAFGDGKLFVSGRSMLGAVDPKTGQPVKSFGTNGTLNAGTKVLEFKDPGKYAANFDPEALGYMIASAPTYFRGTLYLGLAQADSLIAGGLIVALDANTGAVKWVFRTIPQGPQDDGWESTKDTWSGPLRQGGGIWTQPAIDAELGLLYANVSNPSPNYDGSSRKGINLFTNSVVALNLNTGKLAWYYQAIHHDIWDWDLMTGPNLFDVTIGGKTVKGLASLAKTCYVYALNRETGEPIFPIVETPVPTKTDMPGDEVWPTQPIPYSARHVPQQPFCSTYPNVTDPELAKRRRPSFHPYLVNEFVIIAPGLTGGPNRGSSSFSPRTGLLYVTGKNDAWSIKAKPVGDSLKPGPGSPGHFQSITEEGKTGVSATQNIAAYNPATGDLAWVSEFPGTTNGGNLVTAGDVLFQAIGRNFYALEARLGKTLATVPMKSFSNSTPLTYQVGDKQYVAIASGGTVLVFGLP